ncbi:hypothetical protein [Rhizosaccharibacter radicis]|uniref:Uncharacterized protein n=1 Tax=Rhizosaccharibacter radicis TaxID=2782605 RepID=A0ABT1VTL7_9PROT|nr:hypothetical protein [Acetobacteraceae bacterium KSS12]
MSPRQVQPPSPNGPPGPPSLVPFLVIAGVLVLIYLGMMLFPHLKRVINTEDCIGSGRTDCLGHP